MRYTPQTMILASLLGMIPGMGHTIGYDGGKVPPRHNYLRGLSRIPVIGTESGDRAEIERVPVGSFNLVTGQRLTLNPANGLPVGDPWVAMVLNLRGELLGGGAAPAGVVVADAPTTLWKLSMNADVDGDIIESDVSARAIYRRNQFLFGTTGEIAAPTIPGIGATTTFNVVLTIPFADPKLSVPMDSVLDTRRYQTVTLGIATGALGDIVTGAANITLQNCVADIEVVRVSPRVPLDPNVMAYIPMLKQHAPITPAGETIVLLDKVQERALKRLLFFASSGSTAGVAFTGPGVNTVIDAIRVYSNVRDHFGGPPGGALTRRTIQGLNKETYGIETWPAGWHIADFCMDGSFLSALATGDKTVLQVLFTYQAGLPGTPQVSALADIAKRPKGTEGQ